MGKSLDRREQELARAVDTLKQVRQARERLDRQEADCVRLLRSEGISWRSIGGLLGVSHESLRRRYAALPRWGGV